MASRKERASANQDENRRANIRAERRRQLDSATFHPDESVHRESNPEGVDLVLATVASAHRYDVKYEEARRAQVASKNPRFPCPDCGATVRLGQGGRLYDIRLRTAHYRVCGTLLKKPTDDQIAAMRDMAKSSQPYEKIRPAGQCSDCGFKGDKCQCE